jgi:23S rRNA pseudouridine1911/1915/1917 synthase
MNSQIELRAATSGLRLADFLALHFPAASLEQISRAVRAGAVLVNGRRMPRAGWILCAGDAVRLAVTGREEIFNRRDEQLPPLEILHEDDDLLIVNKPPGMLSHPSARCNSGALLHAAAAYVLQSGRKNARRPFLLHRLDADTSGALALALNERAAAVCSRAFQEHRVKKTYLALVNGCVEPENGAIDAPIGPTPRRWPHWRVTEKGSPAVTNFRVVGRFERHTLLSLQPLTGRTHQLRIHCAHIGHPVAGDKIYHTGKMIPVPGGAARRHLLHAQRLCLPHPSQPGEIEATAPLPADFSEVLACLTAGASKDALGDAR